MREAGQRKKGKHERGLRSQRGLQPDPTEGGGVSGSKLRGEEGVGAGALATAIRADWGSKQYSRSRVRYT